jgi:hypothetical protein
MNAEAKGFLTSVTIWGAIALAVNQGLAYFNVGVTIDDPVGMSSDVANLVGLIMVIVGRFRATKPIKLFKS